MNINNFYNQRKSELNIKKHQSRDYISESDVIGLLMELEKQLTLTDVGCSKNKEQALARLKILKDINNEYESNELEVSNKFFLKELKKHITIAFWHGWNL